MARVLVFLYGLACYVLFLGTFLYAVGFLGNFVVPKSIDSAPAGSMVVSLIVNLLLLGVFGVQHSFMARRGFKKWWTRFIPKPMESSTYVLFTNLALILLFWQWRPIGVAIWDIQDPVVRGVIHGLCAFGWLTVLVTTFLINHFDLFGLRQVYLYLRGRQYTPLGFVTPGPYKYIRHPLYVGWFCAFWATPTMTLAHLVFALGTTLYVLIAIRFEERDLVHYYGLPYSEYRRSVPLFVPRWRRHSGAERGKEARVG